MDERRGQQRVIAMSAHPPPVPPEQRPPHGTERASNVGGADQARPAADPNTPEQARQGNTKQNVTNKGLQQDR